MKKPTVLMCRFAATFGCHRAFCLYTAYSAQHAATTEMLLDEASLQVALTVSKSTRLRP